MNGTAKAVAIGALVGVVLWLATRREAVTQAINEGVYQVGEIVDGAGMMLDKAFNSVAWGNMRKLIPIVDQVRYDKNVIAFLHVIRHGESRHDTSAYKLMNGGESFTAPPWLHPGRVFPGGVSTAAGAYQFVKATWEGIVSETGLSDFSPVNQERAALFHMAYLGALPFVIAGQFEAAIGRTNKDSGWTSLPGGSQQQHTIQEAKRVFIEYGGRLAA